MDFEGGGPNFFSRKEYGAGYATQEKHSSSEDTLVYFLAVIPHSRTISAAF